MRNPDTGSNSVREHDISLCALGKRMLWGLGEGVGYGGLGYSVYVTRQHTTVLNTMSE